jgi:DNA polymerase III delta prime subunit
MDREDALELTSTIAKGVDCQFRLIRLAQKFGVLEALKVDTIEEYVQSHLGGYLRYTQQEKISAVAELAAEGLTNVAIGAILGTDEASVRRAKQKLESANAELTGKNTNENNGRNSARAELDDPGETIKLIHKKFDEAIQAENKAHKARVAAGVMLNELKAKVINGHNGDWWSWYETRFVRSRREAEKVMTVAREES